MGTTTKPPLLTRRFLVVVLTGLAYFFAIGMLLPLVPLYTKFRLGGSEGAVGFAVAAFALGAIVVRPWAGHIGNRYGRKVLVISGALIVAATVFSYQFTSTFPAFVALRIIGGIGEAAFFVGAGTMVTDIAPAERRGEALSFWSIAVYGGLAFGPYLGESLHDRLTFAPIWTATAAFALTAAVIGVFSTETHRAEHRDTEAARGSLLHRAALGPGTILFLGLLGMAGFQMALPLYARQLGMADSRDVYLLYAITVLIVRLLGARVPDRLGPRRTGSAGLAVATVGLATMAAWASPVGLAIGTFVYAVGVSQLYPAMILLALTDLGVQERAAAMGTVSTFFDLAAGIGASALGQVAEHFGYRGSFVVAAVITALAGGLLQPVARTVAQRSERTRSAANIPANS